VELLVDLCVVVIMFKFGKGRDMLQVEGCFKISRRCYR
jgi:hypothetical protein